MKRFILFVTPIFVFSILVKGQEKQKDDRDRNYFYMGGGLATAYISPKGLNYTLDKFNTNNSLAPASLSDKFGKFHLLSGWSANIGFLNNKFSNGWFIDYRLSILKGMQTASGVSNLGQHFSHDIRLNHLQSHITAGFMPVQTLFFDFGFGTDMLIYSQKLQTRLGVNPFATSDENLGVGLSAFPELRLFLFRGFPLSLFARPYYFFEIIPTASAEGLNNEINPTTAQNENEDKLKYNSSHFGLQLSAQLVIFAAKQKSVVKTDKVKTTKKQTKGFE